MVNRNIYRLFGLTLASDISFASRMVSVACDPELFFCQADGNCDLADRGKRIFPQKDQESYLWLYKQEDHYQARIDQAVDFYIYPDRIEYNVLDPARRYLVEICFLGEVISIWLESKGITALHASAVSKDGKAAAFLSTNRGGKSALAASLMKEGHLLLTDDILAIEEVNNTFFGRPGYPQMKMWEDEAKYFLGSYEELDTVHPLYNKRRIPVGTDGFGSFCDRIQPIAAFYLPDRQSSDCGIRIEAVSPRDAVIEIIRNSFSAGIVEAMGMQIERMQFFVQMLKRIPMRRLIYPSGFQNLPEVNRAVMEDLEKINL